MQYVLQLETHHNHDDGGVDHESLGVFGTLEGAVAAMRAYLPSEFGDEYETDVFESVDEEPDECSSCGFAVVAVDMEGDVLRLWIQGVSKKTKKKK